jgi:hypothetical protein
MRPNCYVSFNFKYTCAACFHACAERYDLKVTPARAKGYSHSFRPPGKNSKASGYVTLLDSRGKEMKGKYVLLTKAVKEAHNDLQALAEHANEKIEELLTQHSSGAQGAQKVSMAIELKFWVVLLLLTYTVHEMTVCYAFVLCFNALMGE